MVVFRLFAIGKNFSTTCQSVVVGMQTGLDAGADIVVQSSHKTLSALTQAAMLHVKGSLIDRERISRSLQMLQVSTTHKLHNCRVHVTP